MKVFKILCMVILMNLLYLNVFADSVVDQSFEPTPVGVSLGLWTIWDGAQTFTVGLTGSLVGFDLYLTEGAGMVRHDVDWSIQTTSSGLPDGNTLASGTFDSDIFQGGQGFLYIDLPSAVPVSNGELLALVISGRAIHPNGSLRWQGAVDSDASYTGGQAFFRRDGSTIWEDLVGGRVSDLGFQTYVNPVAIDNCDLNEDGVFTFRDIAMFFRTCNEGTADWECDLNGDESFNIADIIPYIRQCKESEEEVTTIQPEVLTRAQRR